jgi:hypothetical protein
LQKKCGSYGFSARDQIPTVHAKDAVCADWKGRESEFSRNLIEPLSEGGSAGPHWREGWDLGDTLMVVGGAFSRLLFQ